MLVLPLSLSSSFVPESGTHICFALMRNFKKFKGPKPSLALVLLFLFGSFFSFPFWFFFLGKEVDVGFNVIEFAGCFPKKPI